MRALALLTLLALSLSPGSARAATSTGSELLEARIRLGKLDFEGAARRFQRALADPQLKGSARAQALLDYGLTLANLNRPEEARKAFAEALRLEPDAALPPNSSPKVEALFAAARPGKASGASAAPTHAEARTEVTQAEPGPAPSALLGPTIAGGVAVAGLVTGVVFGLRSSSAASDLRAGVPDRATADALLSRQHSSAVVSAVGYGAAVAGAATAVTLFLLGRSAPVQAAWVPLPGGGALALSGELGGSR